MSQNPEQGDRLVASAARPHRPAKPAANSKRIVRNQIASVLVWMVYVATRLAALVLVLYAVFTVFRANPANIWYQFVESLAEALSLGLSTLFQLVDDRWEALVNYGLAAVVWLIIGSVVAGLIRRILGSHG